MSIIIKQIKDSIAIKDQIIRNETILHQIEESAMVISKAYPGLASIALTTDTSIITAIGNDYGFEKIFARQIEALGVSGDIFIGISTSGNSN